MSTKAQDRYPHWHIIKSAPLAEIKVHDALFSVGISVFTPCEITAKTSANKKPIASVKPLLQGYMFAKVPMNHPTLLDLHGRRMVYWFLGANHEPYVVTQGEIDSMDKATGYAQYDPRKHSEKHRAGVPEAYMTKGLEFKIDDYVQFERGIHDAIPLRVMGFSNGNTDAKVMGSFMGRKIEQTIPISELVLLRTGESR